MPNISASTTEKNSLATAGKDKPRGRKGAHANGARTNGAEHESTAETPPPAAIDGSDKTIAGVLGEVVWLMSQSPVFKQFMIGDLEWLVMPPILLRQFRIFYHEGKPVAMVLYAFVSDEVERRIEAGAPSMRPGDWKSGDRAWIIQVIAPFGQQEAFAKETRETVLKGKDVRMELSRGAKS